MARLLAPLGLAVLAFGVRALSWRTVFVGSGVHLPEPDAWYHLRRIVYAIRNEGEHLTFDPFLNFPHGGEAIWSPLFDRGVATLMRPFFASAGDFSVVDLARVEQAVVWLPPLLGAATVVVLYRWMHRHFGSGAALASGICLALLPGSVTYARVGVVDHHVAVALVAALMLGAAMDLLRAFEADRLVQRRVIWLGLLQALLLEVWPGGLLHVVLVDCGLIGFALTRARRADAIRFVWVFGSVQVVALAANLASGVASPPDHIGVWSPVVLSRFQPLFFAGAALPCAVSGALWHKTSLDAGRVARSLQLLGATAVVAVLALWLLPGLAEGAGEAGTWLGRADRFQGSVIESRPILYADDGFDTFLAQVRLSRFALIAPLVWLWLVVREARRERRAEFFLLAVFALGLGLATLAQARFVNSFAVPLSALLGIWVVVLWRAFVSADASRSRRGAVALGAVVIAVWMFQPVAWSYVPDLRNQLGGLRGEPVRLDAGGRYWLALEETARWIRARTPSAGDAYAPGVKPAFGLLGHWQYGHLLQYVAERPTVVGNFGDDVGGDNYRLSFRYVRSSEPQAVALLDDLRVRYVVIRPIDVGGGDLGEETMINQLAKPDPDGLGHHRLVYERRVLENEQPRSHFRVFERVAGADIRGRAPPDVRVEARLAYASPTGRRGVLRRATRSNSEGHYRLRLPYASLDGPPGIVVEPAWRVSLADGEGHRLVVADAAVRAGSQLRGPDLR